MPVVDLRSAEVDLRMADHVSGAVRAVLSEPLRQAPAGGLRKLHDQLLDHLARSGQDMSGRRVAVTAGASGAFSALVLAMTQPGDGILLPNPGFPGHRKAVEVLGRVVLSYTAPNDHDDERWMYEIERQSDVAEMVVWISPHNPTGRLNAAAAYRISELASQRNLFLVSDEVFDDLSWASPHISPLVYADPERSAGIWSSSKSMRLAAMRVGWTASAKLVIERVTKSSWALTMSTSLPGQIACSATLSNYASILSESREHVLGNLRAVRDSVALLCPVEMPEGGTCIWLDMRWAGQDSRNLAEILRTDYRVRVWPGEHFGVGGEGHIRISAGVGEEVLAAALPRLTSFLGQMKGLNRIAQKGFQC